MYPLIIVLLAACLIFMSEGMYQLCGRDFVIYKLTKTSLLVTLLGFIPLFGVRYNRIASIGRMHGFRGMGPDFYTLRGGNRIIGPIVEIIAARLLFNRALITPDNPDDFIAQVEQRIAALH